MKAVRQFVAGGGVFFGVLVLVLGFVSPAVVGAVADKIANVFVTNDAANPIPVSVVKDPGPIQFVTLTRLSASSAGYRQQFANGDSDAVDYSVPAGSVLVVTDIDVVFRRGAAEAGQTASFFLTSNDGASPISIIRARLQATLNGNGDGADGQHLQTGIVLAPGLTLGDNLTNASFDAVTVRGYLAGEE